MLVFFPALFLQQICTGWRTFTLYRLGWRTFTLYRVAYIWRMDRNAYKQVNDYSDNPKRFWSYVRSKTQSRTLPQLIKSDNRTSSDVRDKVQLFNSYFYSVFCCCCSKPSDDIKSTRHFYFLTPVAWQYPDWGVWCFGYFMQSWHIKGHWT